ncbi:MAG: hypothetical protein IIC08_01750 [Proteobacteria bacterium]|nr:hypothetical protein [Pseudomonadota bacterium]
MSGIDTLIRLHRQHLDVKRVYRTKIETQRLELERRADAMRRELEDEKKTAAVSLEARQTFSAYAERMVQSLRALAAGMIEIDTETARIDDEIAEAFRALKSYELTRDARLKRAAEEQARRDRAELDEIGAIQHRRQKIF